MVEQAIAPILIGVCIAGIVIANVPKEPVFFNPEEMKAEMDGRGDKDEKSKDSSGIPKPTSMRELAKAAKTEKEEKKEETPNKDEKAAETAMMEADK